MTNKQLTMKKGLMMATRGVIYFMALSVVVVCGILLPEIAREEAVGKAIPPLVLPFLVGAWILSIPIFYALFQTLKLVQYIDTNKAFSTYSVNTLQHIKMSAIVFALLVVISGLLVIMITRSADPQEEIIPIITLTFIFSFIASVIATFIAVLQKLLKEAIIMKDENDLIV